MGTRGNTLSWRANQDSCHRRFHDDSSFSHPDKEGNVVGHLNSAVQRFKPEVHEGGQGGEDVQAVATEDLSPVARSVHIHEG